MDPRKLLERYPRLSLFAAAFLARAVLSLAIGPASDADPPLLEMAKNINLGNGPLFFDQGITLYSWLPPLFSYLMVPYLKIFGENLEPLRWILILWSSLACVQLSQLGKKHLGPKGAWAGWIWALYPPQIFWSSRANPFTIGTNLLILLIWWLEHRKDRKTAALTGLLWAALSLTRSEYFLMSACVMLYLWLADQKKIQRTLIFAGCFALGMSPWIVRNWKIFHSFVPLTTNSSLIFWFTFNDTYRFTGDMRSLPADMSPATLGENEVQMGKRLTGVTLNYIKEHPERSLYIWLGNLVHFWRPYLSADARDVSPLRNLVYIFSYVPVFLLFLLGLRQFPYKDPFWLLILSLIAVKWLSHSGFYVIVHFREVIAPLLILIAARGLTRQVN